MPFNAGQNANLSNVVSLLVSLFTVFYDEDGMYNLTGVKSTFNQRYYVDSALIEHWFGVVYQVGKHTRTDCVCLSTLVRKL